MINFRLILLVFFLFLTGCVQTIPESTPPSDTWRTSLKQIKHFRSEGKMAFISPQKRLSANFVWQQQDDEYSLDLNTFIGTNVLRLKRHPYIVELDIDGEQYQGHNAQSLVYRLSGWLLPLDTPEQWLLAAYDAESAQFDQQQRVRSACWLSPDNRQWQIRYQNYEAIQGVWLPTRITLSHDTLRVKLLINEWQLQ